MANIYLGNAFSLSMLDIENFSLVRVKKVSKEEIPQTAISCIGHPDTAACLEDMLGFPVPMNRTSIGLEREDVLYVAQLRGGRLPEGATTLPVGFDFDFYEVTVKPEGCGNCPGCDGSNMCTMLFWTHGLGD